MLNISGSCNKKKLIKRAQRPKRKRVLLGAPSIIAGAPSILKKRVKLSLFDFSLTDQLDP